MKALEDWFERNNYMMNLIIFLAFSVEVRSSIKCDRYFVRNVALLKSLVPRVILQRRQFSRSVLLQLYFASVVNCVVCLFLLYSYQSFDISKIISERGCLYALEDWIEQNLLTITMGMIASTFFKVKIQSFISRENRKPNV